MDCTSVLTCSGMQDAEHHLQQLSEGLQQLLSRLAAAADVALPRPLALSALLEALHRDSGLGLADSDHPVIQVLPLSSSTAAARCA